MDIRVTDERESGGGGRQNRDVYRARMTPRDWDEDPLVLPYAPVPYDISSRPNWQPRNAAGVEVDGYDWTHSTGRALSFEQVYQAGASEAVRSTFEVEAGTVSVVGIKGGSAKLATMLSTLERWANRPTPNTQEPTRVQLEMGVEFIEGHISELSVSIEQTDAQGLPTVARLMLTVTESRLG